MPAHETVLLGLGNLLLHDEGLGIEALHRIDAGYELQSNIRLLDGGVMGLELLTFVEHLDGLLVLDAVMTGAAPGTLIRLEGDAIPRALALKTSMHQVGFQEVLALCRLRGTLPARMVVWGMEPEVLEPGVALSASVTRQLDALVGAALDELRGWGYAVRARTAALKAIGTVTASRNRSAMSSTKLWPESS